MSQSLPAAAEIDWKLVASAVAVFFGTVVTTVWGWMQGRKKVKEAPAVADTGHIQVIGAALQDNISLRDNTQAVRDLRDQIMLLGHTMERRHRVEDELRESLEDLVKRLDSTA